MRSETISLAPGSDGAFAAGGSTGLAVAALKAFSASEKASDVGRRAMMKLLPRPIERLNANTLLEAPVTMAPRGFLAIVQTV